MGVSCTLGTTRGVPQENGVLWVLIAWLFAWTVSQPIEAGRQRTLSTFSHVDETSWSKY